MATVTAQAASITGTVPTMAAASAGGDLVETGDTVSLVVCAGATPATLTITTPNTVSGLAIADAAVTIPAGAGTSGTAGPVIVSLPTSLFGNASGLAALAWSATTDVKFAVVRR
jgi:hypothetical protein